MGLRPWFFFDAARHQLCHIQQWLMSFVIVHFLTTKPFFPPTISCLTWQASKKEMAEGEINGDVVIKKLSAWIVKGKKELPLPPPQCHLSTKSQDFKGPPQRVTKRCRLSWLTNIAPSYMSPNAGGGGKLRGLSQWVQLYAGAHLNFEDLAPFLTYGPPLPMPSSLPHLDDVNLLRSDGGGRRNQHR